MKSRNYVYPYPSELVSDHPSVEYILENYFPTLKQKVVEVLQKKTRRIDENFLIDDIPKNTSVISPANLEKNKFQLKIYLDNLLELVWGKKPIVFIADGCFTNDLFVRELKEMLEDDFDRYVEQVAISYTDETKNTHIKDHLYENSIVILGGSFSDLEDIPSWFLESDLARFIKDVHNGKVNNKLIWICWWQQLISSIIGFEEIFSEKIITTYKWVAQFWVMPGQLIWDMHQIPYLYRNIVNSITDNSHGYISSVYTRTWHVDFNFLDSYTLSSNSIHPLFVDSISGSPLIWWTKNGNILWNQAHFEINPSDDKLILEEQFHSLIPSLQQVYGRQIENILLNIKRGEGIESLFQAFYSSALLSFSYSIIKKHLYFHTEKRNSINSEIQIHTDKQLKDFIARENFWEVQSHLSLMERLEHEWFLRLLTIFDWKVNRWLVEASEILWIDLWGLIKHHKGEKKWDYVFRDWWAGNGKLLEDINSQIDILAYGVSDYWYFNIYESLIWLEEFRDIPRNVMKIFVYELITSYKQLKQGSIKQRVVEAMQWVNFHIKSYKEVSMFADKTYRFNDLEKQLNDSELLFIEQNKQRFEELKEYIEDHFYEMLVWYFDNIIFSDFNSLHIPYSTIKTVDFQVAIRSTCHVDSKDLEKILDDYVKISAKPWSIYIDNGVVRSDSWVCRINEYLELEKRYEDIKVYFIYDSNTSYITSAIILRETFACRDMFENWLHEWHLFLSSEKVSACDFFKIERFFRELMILTFKNLQFSHDKNKRIIDFLKQLSWDIHNSTPKEIKYKIIDEINDFIEEINYEYGESYTKISWMDFDFYLSKVHTEIREFFLKWEIENPEWFNNDFNRKN